MGVDSLRKFSVHEHVIPLNVLIKRMVEECYDEESIYGFISTNNKLIFVTKEEDDKLNAAGYQRKLPSNGEDRYDAVGMEVHPEPILFKNRAKNERN